MSRGIFSLNESYNEQISGDWSTASDVWLNVSPVIVRESDVGYIAGGDSGSGAKLSTVERIDYSNDTAKATQRGSLAAGSYIPAGNSSITHAYFGGGENPTFPGAVTTIQRIDYSNDTALSTPRGPLSQKRSKFGGTGTKDYGYFGGGMIPGFSSTVDRLDYANDTATAVAKGSLSGGVFYTVATGNQSHGYFHLGTDGGNKSTIDRLDYSSDSTACVTKGPLTVARFATMASTNGNLYGYFVGGTSNPPDLSTVNRIDYSNDTANAASPAFLSGTQARGAGLGNSNYGYYAAGSSPIVSTVNRIDYSNDTANTLARGPLSRAKYGNAATSAASISAMTEGLIGAALNTSFTNVPVGTDYAYTFGGYDGSYYSTIQRIDFSNDTATTPQVASLPNAMSNRATVGNTNYAWVQPGSTPAGTNLERFDYSNDTSGTTTKASTLKGNSNDNTGTQNFGYFQSEHPETSITRLDYANDTIPTIFRVTRSVSNQVYNGGSASNSSYGYFAGGGQNGTAGGTTMDRIDYSNDTASLTQKGPLTSNQTYGVAATGSANFAYWSGGTGGSGPAPGARSTTDRLDFSSDTTATVEKGPLTSAKYRGSSTGNRSYGYYSGGKPGGGQSDIDRIDYSSDSTAMTPKGNLSHPSNAHSSESSRANALPTENIYSTTVSSNTEARGTKNFGKNEYGYWVGGPLGTEVCRIDYGNDTVTSIKSNLTAAGSYKAAVSNTNYGYAAGGQSPNYSTVDRIDYGNDTATAVAKGPLSADRAQFAAVGNQDYGYLGAGNPAVTTVERIDYSNDTADPLVKGSLTYGSRCNSAVGNPNYGYWGAAKGPGGQQSIVDRVDYSSDTATSVLKGPLPTTRYESSATGNAHYGYFGGGGDPLVSTVDRIDYSNDTATAVSKGPLTDEFIRMGATGNISNGYFAGSGAPTVSSSINRVDFSNDTAAASLRANLTETANAISGFSSKEDGLPQYSLSIGTPFAFGENTVSYPYGYFGGGYYPGAPNGCTSQIDRVDYSNDTAAASTKGNLTFDRWAIGAIGNVSHGYFASARTGSVNGFSTVERLDYSNDILQTSIRGPLNNSIQYSAAVGNEYFGYVMGGWSPSNKSDVDRINYANDTTTASPRGKLSLAKWTGGAAGNKHYGWWGGARDNANYYSSTDRITYTNDTVTATPKGPLSASGEGIAATGNEDFGYYMGGQPGRLSIVDRIDYSNDTATALQRSNMPDRYLMSGTGNKSHGYYGGGRTGGNQRHTSIFRIDYASDTTNAAPKGDLTAAGGYGVGALSAQANALTQGFVQGTIGSYNSGYFGGGAIVPGYTKLSTVERIDYSNDTATASVRGPLVAARWYIGGTSSPSHGYWIGGKDPSNKTTWVDRIDYSNDTSVASERGPLSVATYRAMSAVSNDNFAYQGGGDAPSTTSRVHRIDFGNDEVTAVAKGPLIGTRYLLSAVGNKSYGYFGGGNFPGRTDVSRLDYSSDTTACVEKGYLASGRRKLGTSGNEDYGWFVAGTTNDTTIIERVDYSNDTATALVRSGLSIRRENFGSTGSYSFGYYAGHSSGKSSTDRLDYANDTALTVGKGNLSAPIGYQGTGASARDNALNLLGNILFPKPDLALSHGGLSATEYGQTRSIASGIPQPRVPVSERGYFCAGYEYNGMGFNSYVERINFGNDTATSVQKGPIETQGSQIAGTSNSDYGYLGGGPNIPVKTTISRIDYSNDTATGTQRSWLTVGRGDLGGTGNLSYGYMGGGHDFNFGPNIWYSMVDRIDYSNDSATTLAKGPLTVARGYLNALGNKNYGYWAGGVAPATKSNIDRLDYANDTTCVAVGALATSMSRLASVSNTDYGYFIGGNPGAKSTVQRVDFSNDTPTASPKGPMRRGASHWDGTSNQNYGYVGGGFLSTISPGSPSTSEVERIDFANDTATGLQRGYLTTRRAQMGAAISASANGRG